LLGFGSDNPGGQKPHDSFFVDKWSAGQKQHKIFVNFENTWTLKARDRKTKSILSV
jgi:hypothetical protein